MQIRVYEKKDLKEVRGIELDSDWSLAFNH